MLLVIVVGAIVAAVAMLWNRDRKRREKTDEQIRAASEASVTDFIGLRRFLVGALLIFGGVAEYIDKGGMSLRAAVLLLIGFAIVIFAIDALRKARDLQKFADFDPSKVMGDSTRVLL